MAQIPLTQNARADVPDQDEERDDGTHQIRPDLAYQRIGIVNVVFYGNPSNGPWVLIDAGLPGTATVIRQAAAARFGKDAVPAAIIMTHAHADHAGALEALNKEWRAPIYAHELELPYLNGCAAYPPPDTGVGGGLMPALSVLFPRGPFDVSRWLGQLPADHSVPEMPGWKWIHTPGHTPGHISLWRASDRTLIAGDAFITTDQESVYAVARQIPEMHGPPTYYTQNWEQAEASVKHLATLEPRRAVTGHGRAMQGEPLRAALRELAEHFHEIAVPSRSVYARHPRSAETGSAYEVKR